MEKGCKRYEQIEHLSDVGLKVYGKNLEELFENTGEGMFSIMCDLSKVEPAIKKEIDITERGDISVEGLLVIWLENLLYRFEVEKILFSLFKVNSIRLNHEKSSDKKNIGARIKAEIFGEKVDFTRHEIIVSIKAPTYHMLKVEKDSLTGNWVAQVIFDI